MAAVKPTTVHWPLANFEKHFAEAAFRTKWTSPEFEVDGVPKAKFSFNFYPKGSDEKFREDCALFLRVSCFGDHPSIRFAGDYWLENGVGERLTQSEYEYVYLPNSSNGWGWSAICTQEDLLELAAGGSLVLCGKITPSAPVGVFEWAEHTAPLAVCRKLAVAFDSQKFADVEVRVQDRVFPVNKLVICSGSPVFDRMFTHDTKECRTGVVEIKQVDADVMELLLRYLYSGEVEGLAEVAHRLLPVADCYEVMDLVELCLASLVEHASVPTVVRDLKLVFAHDHEGAFKRKLCTFVHENLQKLKDEPDWTLSFVRDNPKIIFEVTVASSR